ncbi:MAG TPA: GntR family transcriptional regulator, partial [Candidatus Hydrogenedentes bacterium]|nr:GntR family transcriptional regulator [Candidatus Hydrogenedentota bacterium]
METTFPPGLPVYVAIKRALKIQIESGELPEGARVPSELELARQYNVSRNPTRQALRDLELEGYITRTPGRGSFVAPISKRQRLLRVPAWRTVAVACPGLECHYDREVMKGFIRAAARRDVHTMVYFRRLNTKDEFEFLADIRNSGIEGIAFWLQHASPEMLDLLHKFRRSNYPFVLLDRYVRGLDSDFVVTDNEDVAFRLTKTLIERGHRAIGIITTELDATSSEDRLRGYRRALQEASLPFQEELMCIYDSDVAPIEACIEPIMSNQHPPTALFVNHDGLATMLLDALAERGYGVPGDIEIATVDDNELSAAVDIPMITASQPGEAIGRESAEVLLGRIEDPTRAPQRRFLPAKFQLEPAIDAHSSPHRTP